MNQSKDSRELAFLILKKVLDDGSTLENALERFSGDVAPKDRGFIRHLVATTLRRLGQLDRIINHCTKTKLGNTQMAIRHVLRLGICQLLFAEVPAYAAVDTSVNLVERRVIRKLHYLKNTVNAILRKVDRDRDELLKKFGNSRLNIPDWMLGRWDAHYGPAVVKKVISEVLCEAPLDISLNAGEDVTHWATELGGGALPTGGLRLNSAGNIPDLPGYNEGAWWVQDLAAQLPVHLLGGKEGDQVLDLCAAPGGKTLQSAAKGSLVTAVDISDKRLQRLSKNLERVSLKADIVTADVIEFNPKRQWRYILLDAPCTSTGTIRRHPEILWSRRQEKIKELSILQSKMLDRAVELLEPGGTMIYCVCSLEAEEGSDQINALLKRHSTLKRKEINKKEMLMLESAILETGDVQTLPYYFHGGMDGFFISRLTKAKGQ